MKASKTTSPPPPPPPPPPQTEGGTMITDLDEDSLVECASRLSLQDLSNLAMTCSSLKRVAYSDSIWQRCFRNRWPREIASESWPTLGAREAYVKRRFAVQQFKYSDPASNYLFLGNSKPFDHVIFMDRNCIVYSQGSSIGMNVDFKSYTLNDHKARITSMRLFPLSETSIFRSDPGREDNVLVTSSCDHTIRLWWKGYCQRCFTGHNGPVSILSDRLLGDGSAKVLASGGEDGTIRLWSFSSSGSGQHASKATLYGDEKAIKLMSVSGHRSSLLVSISQDSKVRVWDTAASSAVPASCCVGTTSVPGPPLDMMCHESLLYVAAGSSVVALDLRTMQKVLTAAVHETKLYSFAILPSESLICTGVNGKALLWDLRKNQELLNPEPIAELDGHKGPVTHTHVDPYKVVTGGREDLSINVWEAATGAITNSFLSCPADEGSTRRGCSAMAVKGTQIVTGSCDEGFGILYLRDFSQATRPVLMHEDQHTSKFWNPQSDSDDNAAPSGTE